MSFTDLARSASDGDLQQRLIAAAAAEGHPNPQTLVLSRIWEIVADPAIAAPYAYACGERMDRPGFYPDVITDEVISSVVGPLVAAEVTPPNEGSV